jgi:hypothetical protein
MWLQAERPYRRCLGNKDSADDPVSTLQHLYRSGHCPKRHTPQSIQITTPSIYNSNNAFPIFGTSTTTGLIGCAILHCPSICDMPANFSLSKYLPRASPHHVEPRDSESADDSGLDVILVYPESREEEKHWPAKFRAMTTSNVYNFRLQPKPSGTEKDAQPSSEESANLSVDTKTPGDYDKSSTRPLVFVAEAPDVRATLEEVRQPEPRMLDHMRRRIPIAGRIYGVIELRQKRSGLPCLSHFKTTCFLAWGQWSTHNIVKSYDTCRQPTTNCQSLGGPTMVTNPSTGVVVFMTLMYILNAVGQYDTNREDYYQKLCLVTGLAMGFTFRPSAPSIELMHTLMATTTMAMTCSALGHLIWRKHFSTHEERLEQKLVEWRDEARRTGTEPYVVKFLELD